MDRGSSLKGPAESNLLQRPPSTTPTSGPDALGRPAYLYDARAQQTVGKALNQIKELAKPRQQRVGSVRVRYYPRVGHENFEGLWTELPGDHETVAQQEKKLFSS